MDFKELLRLCSTCDAQDEPCLRGPCQAEPSRRAQELRFRRLRQGRFDSEKPRMNCPRVAQWLMEPTWDMSSSSPVHSQISRRGRRVHLGL
jgi:hypothetical protein